MINSKELRQGNLFKEEYTGKYIPVLEILRNGNIVFDFETKEKWQAIPIPLTEDVLVNVCGFEKDGDTFYSLFVDNDNIFTYYYTYSGSTWHLTYNNDDILLDNRFLHSFQNFYHITTGQELTVNL